MSMNQLGFIHDKDIRNRWIQILDQGDQVRRTHKAKVTHFLNPGEWIHTVSVMNNFADLVWRLDGGFKQAERKRLIITPDYLDAGEIPSGIIFLNLSYSSKSRDRKSVV